MRKIIKKFHYHFGYEIRNVFRRLGYDIVKFRPEKMGVYAYHDMAKFVTSKKPVLFDVGAHKGQTIIRLNDVFKNCIIHAFEPSPSTFELLKENTAKLKHVTIWNNAMGSATTTMFFNENTVSEMSSFLELGDHGWGKISNRTSVNVTTIDAFCETQKIEKIDVLKLDTQGFELEILKGAETSISKHKIGLLYFEVTFLDLYKGLPSFTALFDFAIACGFELVTIYPLQYGRNNIALGTDILFIHKSYH